MAIFPKSMMKVAGNGSPQVQQSRGLPPRRPAPQGHIVNLGPSVPTKPAKKTRSISVPKQNSPGLAIMVPPAISRQSSQSSQQSRQEESLLQLKTLKQQLAAENIQAKKAAAAKPKIPIKTSTEGQSPYLSLATLSSASDIIKSPLSCLSVDYMQSQVQDEFEAIRMPPANANYKQKDARPPLPSSILRTEQPKTQDHSTLLTIVKKVSSNLPQKKGNIINQREVPSSQIPGAFDMQKSLENQLAMLPGSRLPETSTTSFDNHSFIISSGTRSLGSFGSKSTQRRLDEVVSVVPCESIVTPQGDMASTLSKNSRQRIRLKSRHRVDAVKIDKGLTCVAPKYVKPQVVQEILQQKKNTKEEEREPAQQMGKIVEAIDLVQSEKHKSTSMKKLGSKLKDTWSRARKGNSKHDNHSKSSSSLFGSRKQRNEQDGCSVAGNTADERLWVKQTIEQENYKITQVLGDLVHTNKANENHNSNTNRDGVPLRVETVTSDILADVLPPSDASRCSENNMEVIMPAEGDNPMYKAPNSSNSTPTQLNQEEKSKPAAASPTKEEQKKMKGDTKIARRLKQKGKLTSLVTEKLEKQKDTFPRSQSEGVNNNRRMGLVLPPRPASPRKQVQAARKEFQVGGNDPRLHPSDDFGGSFCLSPSLTLENNFSLNRSITDVAKIFAQERANGKGVDAFLANEERARSGGDTGPNGRTKADAMREARLALMFSLKHRIVTELKNQKLREHEAAIKGETISKEEKAQQMESVRRLHLRREALQQLSDEEIREAFQVSLQRTRSNTPRQAQTNAFSSSNVEDATLPSRGEKADNKGPQEATANRKTVSFAQQTTEKIIPQQSMASTVEDKEDEDQNDSDEDDEVDLDELTEFTEFSELTGLTNISRSRLMSWADCGLRPIDLTSDFKACGQIDTPQQRSRDRHRNKSASKKTVPNDAGSIASNSTSASVARKVRLRGVRSAPLTAHGLTCGAPPGGHYGIEESCSSSSDSDIMSDSASSYSSGGSQRRRRHGTKTSSRRGKARRPDTLTNVLSSGSLTEVLSGGSFETRDTRDTRMTEYTEATRDSYDTRDNRGSFDSRDSDCSYDTRDSYRRRREARRSKSRPRSRSRSGRSRSRSKSKRGSQRGSRTVSRKSIGRYVSEYKEDRGAHRYDDDDSFLRCGPE